MTCRNDEGGDPKCLLGSKCKSIEIRGKSLSSIEISRNLRMPYAAKNEFSREYDLFLILESPSWLDDANGGIGFDENLNATFKMVLSSGFKREKVFVTYLTRCFTKRNPTVQEIKTCSQYLQKELELTKPKVVMLLGSKTLRAFNLHNKGGINVIRGKVFDVPLPGDSSGTTYKVIPTFSTGYISYTPDPQVEIRIKSDYEAAYSVSRGTVEERPNLTPTYEVLTSVSEVRDFVSSISKSKLIAFDTESRALGFMKEPLICLSFCSDGETCAIIPIYKHDPNGLDWKLAPVWSNEDLKEVISLLRLLFENPEIGKAAHNIKYDINVIRRHLGIQIKGFLFDSMLMHHLLIEQKPHDLEYLSDLEFGTGNYSAPLHDIVGKGKELIKTYDHIPDELLYPYTALDVKCCFNLTKIYFNKLQDKPHLWKLYCEETEPLIQALADAEWAGHYVDQSLLKDFEKEYTDEQAKYLEEIKKLTWDEFNPNSPANVKTALIKLGFETQIRDDRKPAGYNTSKEVLLKLKEYTPLADYILKYRNTTKIIGTYLENLAKDIDADGRVRYSWLIHGTETGRASCRFLHQIPRPDKFKKKNLREMLIAAPGYKLVYMDYSQIELRVLALVANETAMLEMFERGEDLHTATAAVMLGIPKEKVSEYNRSLGKNTNFGLAYGSEGFRLISTNSWQDDNGNIHPFTWDMFNAGMVRFKETFPRLVAYLESIPDRARRNNNTYVTQFGRERRIGSKLCDRNTAVRKAAERELVNFTIQSVAGAITVRTLGIMHKYIVSWRETGQIKEDDIRLVNTVHDSGAWEVRERLARMFAKTLKKVTERPIPELMNYSFPSAIGIGDNWLQAEKNKITEWK